MDDELRELAETPYDEIEHHDEPIFEWRKPSGEMDDCVLCGRPTRSHLLGVETAPMTGFALRICHSCFEKYDGDGSAILDAFELNDRRRSQQ